MNNFFISNNIFNFKVKRFLSLYCFRLILLFISIETVYVHTCQNRFSVCQIIVSNYWRNIWRNCVLDISHSKCDVKNLYEMLLSENWIIYSPWNFVDKIFRLICYRYLFIYQYLLIIIIEWYLFIYFDAYVKLYSPCCQKFQYENRNNLLLNSSRLWQDNKVIYSNFVKKTNKCGKIISMFWLVNFQKSTNANQRSHILIFRTNFRPITQSQHHK